MVLTILAERRNSPSSGRPSTSSRTVCVKIALRHGGDRAGDFGGRAQQVFHQRVDRDFHLAPGAPGLVEPRAFAGLAFLADHLADALQLLRHLLVGGDDVVEGVGDLSRPSPVQEPGRRTEKSPSRMVCRLARMTARSAAETSARPLPLACPLLLAGGLGLFGFRLGGRGHFR